MVLVLGLLFVFLVAIQLMSGAFKLFGEAFSAGLFDGVENPFAGLAVGILATVLVQSSSATTSTIVALVGSSQLSVAHAVPMILGANIGTTVTNTLVSIGHMRRSAELKRAFAAATVHDFFNVICVAFFLPIELATGFLSNAADDLSSAISGRIGGGDFDSPIKTSIKSVYELVLGTLEAIGIEGGALASAVLILGVGLVFLSLVWITRNMRVLVAGPMERGLNNVLGRSGLLGVALGIATTVAVQSSSITTSLLVPMCAAGILTLENAFPIMLGANIGTTVTALLASLAVDDRAGLSIALVHFLFNALGVALFLAIPPLRKIPLGLARGLAERSARNPAWLFTYVLGLFVVLPVAGWLIFHRLSN